MKELVKKDMKLFFSNRQDIMLTFALPIIFITLFAYIFGKMQNSEESNLIGLVHAVAGTSVFMLLFSVAGIGGSLLDEKQEGILKKLLCSPIPANSILHGKLVFAFIISVIQLIVMFIYAWLIFDLDIMNHLSSLVLMIFSIAFACSGFGIVIASFAKTRQQVQGYSSIIILVMSGLGGSMIPIFVMPEIMQKIAVFTVNYWGIQGIYDIFWKLIPLTDSTFLLKVFVLLCIGFFLNFIALLIFRKNILKMI
jgi:ABC-type transport system involved in cytochrome c biogenesis permease component